VKPSTVVAPSFKSTWVLTYAFCPAAIRILLPL